MSRPKSVAVLKERQRTAAQRPDISIAFENFLKRVTAPERTPVSGSGRVPPTRTHVVERRGETR